MHWTGRGKADDAAFETLAAICSERLLRLTFCPTYVRDEFRPEIAMVCFTDIPLRESDQHCRTFGRCGLQFKKDVLIGYGANPVLYTTPGHFQRIRALIDLQDRMLDLEKDREWKETGERYQFTREETFALLETLGFFQDYSYKGGVEEEEAINYAQREWRLTFHTLPFASGGTTQAPGMGGLYIRGGETYRTMAFAHTDVTAVVAPKAYSSHATQLAHSLGCDYLAFEDAVPVSG